MLKLNSPHSQCAPISFSSFHPYSRHRVFFHILVLFGDHLGDLSIFSTYYLSSVTHSSFTLWNTATFTTKKHRRRTSVIGWDKSLRWSVLSVLSLPVRPCHRESGGTSCRLWWCWLCTSWRQQARNSRGRCCWHSSYIGTSCPLPSRQSLHSWESLPRPMSNPGHGPLTSTSPPNQECKPAASQ